MTHVTVMLSHYNQTLSARQNFPYMSVVNATC